MNKKTSFTFFGLSALVPIVICVATVGVTSSKDNTYSTKASGGLRPAGGFPPFPDGSGNSPRPSRALKDRPGLRWRSQRGMRRRVLRG